MRARADGRGEAEVVLFVGPTMATSPRARALARRLTKRPPARRSDVARWIDAHDAPGVIAIVDGVFHDTLAVGHAEIRDAIGRGFRVWGLSSMGAIRAREMAPLGMRGFGRVFERFEREPDFQDDEVALLHEPTPPYRALTEPLVHLRVAIDHLVARGLVGEPDAAVVLVDLKSRWYGDRTRRRAIEALARAASGPGGAGAVRDELRAFDRFAIKTLDLERFLEERPWAEEPRGRPAPRARKTDDRVAVDMK